MKILLLLTFLVPTLVYSQAHGNGGGTLPGERASIKRKEKIKKCTDIVNSIIIGLLNKPADFKIANIKNPKEIRSSVEKEYYKLVVQVPGAIPKLSLEQAQQCEQELEKEDMAKNKLRYGGISSNLKTYKTLKCHKFNRFNKYFKGVDIDNAIQLLDSLSEEKLIEIQEENRG